MSLYQVDRIYLLADPSRLVRFGRVDLKGLAEHLKWVRKALGFAKMMLKCACSFFLVQIGFSRYCSLFVDP